MKKILFTTSVVIIIGGLLYINIRASQLLYNNISNLKQENESLSQKVDSLQLELTRYQKATMLYMNRAASYRGNSDDN